MSGFGKDRPILLGIAIWVGMPLLALCLPVLLPFVLVRSAYETRRRRREAGQTRCERCGASLGPASLDRADAYWSAWLRKLHDDHPGCRFRLVRRIYAVCLACGAQYDYDARARRYVRLPPDGEYEQPAGHAMITGKEQGERHAADELRAGRQGLMGRRGGR